MMSSGYTYSNSSPIPWHELTKTGDTTIRFLLVEKKYEPVSSNEQAINR
jgi:hypothetical protein